MSLTPPELSSEDIRALPEYKDLLHQRRILAWPLCLIVLVSYYSFVLAVAYYPDVLAQTIGDGVTSVGILAGLGLILLTFAVTAIFVWRTNATSTILLARIKEKAGGIQ